MNHPQAQTTLKRKLQAVPCCTVTRSPMSHYPPIYQEHLAGSHEASNHNPEKMLRAQSAAMWRQKRWHHSATKSSSHCLDSFLYLPPCQWNHQQHDVHFSFLCSGVFCHCCREQWVKYSLDSFISCTTTKLPRLVFSNITQLVVCHEKCGRHLWSEDKSRHMIFPIFRWPGCSCIDWNICWWITTKYRQDIHSSGTGI